MHTNTTPDQLLVEIRHFASEALHLRSISRAPLRREIIESLCSRLAMLPAVRYKYSNTAGASPNTIEYVKYVQHGKVEVVYVSGATGYGRVWVHSLLEWARPSQDSKIESELTLLLNLLTNDSLDICSEQQYLDGMKAMWVQEGGQTNA